MASSISLVIYATIFLAIKMSSTVAIKTNFDANRSIIVHLFEWKFNDIARECEEYLSPNGYAGVQVSPVSENVIVENRPWWERYQPISYHIATRSGTESEFDSMVERCNRVGVRIYVDVVPNHVTGKTGQIIGTGGSTANVDKLQFPSIPYGPEDFHSPCIVNNYNDANEVRNCELCGMPDLNQGRDSVRKRIIGFLNRLIDAGVAGFRVDAAKHMWPADLEVIYGSLKHLNAKIFPRNTKPFIYQEVIDLGDEAVKKAEYISLGAVTEFKFSAEIGKAFNGNNQLKWMQSWGQAWGLLPSDSALVFVDNHDNQRSSNPDILTHKSRQRYIMAVAFMLAHPYGIPRVMSSFGFTSFDQGPPADSNGNIISPKINLTTGQCENGWICEHRWPEIRNMIKFHNTVGSAPRVAWWDNDGNQIAFCRGIRGFVAFNNEPYELNAKLFTCVQSGIYCDVITGQAVNGKCTGIQVRVDENGEAEIRIPANVGVLAIHIGERIDVHVQRPRQWIPEVIAIL